MLCISDAMKVMWKILYSYWLYFWTAPAWVFGGLWQWIVYEGSIWIFRLADNCHWVTKSRLFSPYRVNVINCIHTTSMSLIYCLRHLVCYVVCCALCLPISGRNHNYINNQCYGNILCFLNSFFFSRQTVIQAVKCCLFYTTVVNPCFFWMGYCH